MADHTHKIPRLAIVGAGPAGLFAALRAAEERTRTGRECKITLFEADERIGRTILVTGNGRCNFSNASLDADEYFHPEFVAKVFDAARDTLGDDYVLSAFRKRGLVWREEAQGRLYPLANKASVIVDLLRESLQHYNITVHLDTPLVKIDAPHERYGHFTLLAKSGAFYRADAVILATGSKEIKLEHMEQVHMHRYRPLLGPLRVKKSHIPLVRELNNIRLKCTLSRVKNADGRVCDSIEESGEVQFRMYGISGICTFNMSRHVREGDVVGIRILPLSTKEEACVFMRKRLQEMKAYYGGSLTVRQFLSGLVLPRIIEALCAHYGLREKDEVDLLLCDKLADLMYCLELPLAGIGDKALCQVRRGGVDVDCVDAETMQLHASSGFFAAGEAVDVDGPCGGYNLHWAWTSGALAGESAFRFLSQIEDRQKRGTGKLA